MEIPHEVAVMTLPNATLFPQALLPLHIFEPRYRTDAGRCAQISSHVYRGDAKAELHRENLPRPSRAWG